MANKITHNFGEIVIDGARYDLEVEVAGVRPNDLQRVAVEATRAFQAFARNLNLPKGRAVDFNGNRYTIGQNQTQYKGDEQRLWGIFVETILAPGQAPPIPNAPRHGQQPPGQPRARVSPAPSPRAPLQSRASSVLIEEVESDDNALPAAVPVQALHAQAPAAVAAPAPILPQQPQAAPPVVPVHVLQPAPVLLPAPLPAPAPAPQQAQPPAPAPVLAAASGSGSAAAHEAVAAASAPAPAPGPMLPPAAESPAHHRPLLLPNPQERAPAHAANDWENRRWGYFRQIIDGNLDLDGLIALIEEDQAHAEKLQEIRMRYLAYRDQTVEANDNALKRRLKIRRIPLIGNWLANNAGFLTETRTVLPLGRKLQQELGDDQRLRHE